MKRINNKGFTLIELLAVIVVLAIILVITVPMVLNSLSSTRQDALNSSAASTVKTYKDQMGMMLLGRKQEGFMIDLKTDSNGKIDSQIERCITKEEAKILGLNTSDYSINISCTGTSNLPGACYNTTGYSTVKWTGGGVITVKLVGATNGKFMSGNTPLVAISSSSGNTNLASYGPSETITLTNTTRGNEIKNLKIYGPTSSSTINITTRGKNLFDGILEKGFIDSTTGENISSIGGVYWRTQNYISVVPNMVFSYTKHLSDSGLFVICYDENKNFLGRIAKIYNNISNITNDKFVDGTKYIRIYWELVSATDNIKTVFDYVQLEQGASATPYEPYQEPVTHKISLGAPLRSNGNKKDYIDFESGKVIRWIGSDGSVLSTPTEETVSLPTIKTLNGTTIISTDSSATIQGSY